MALICLSAGLLLGWSALFYLFGALLEPASARLDRAARRRACRLALQAARRRPVFWGLLVSFALLSFAEGLVLSHAVPALVEFGQAEALALLAMALLGPCMTAGRFCLLWFRPNGSSLPCAILAAIGMAGGIALMPFAGAQAGAGLFAMVLFGLGFGLVIVLKPILVTECLGYTSIGALLGAMALPCFSALATAPYAGALLWERGGYALALPVAALAASAGALGLLALATLRRGQRRGWPGGAGMAQASSGTGGTPKPRPAGAFHGPSLLRHGSRGDT